MSVYNGVGPPSYLNLDELKMILNTNQFDFNKYHIYIYPNYPHTYCGRKAPRLFSTEVVVTSVVSRRNDTNEQEIKSLLCYCVHFS